jgi:predicted permease
LNVRALFYTLVARVRGFLRPDALDEDFEQEMAAHLAAAEEDGIRGGLTRDEARRVAHVQLGGLTQLGEASRAAQGLPWLGTCWLDIKLGVRLLFKHPGLTLVSTLALAIGIAIVAGFHAGTEFMMRPVLPANYAQGDRIVAIWHHDVARSDRGEQTLGDMLAWRQALTSVQEVGAFVLQERAVAGRDGQTRLVHAAQISASAFALLRVAPLLGRPLVENDERPGSAAVALLGFELWQSALHSDPAIVGKTIRVGGAEHTVVGVMPSGFAFPRREQLWTPLRVPPSGLRPGSGPAIDMAFGRLAPDVTLREAEAELEVVGLRLTADHRQTHSGLRPRIAPYARSFLEANEPGLALLISAARVLIGIVVLIVAVNVGTLVYARNAARVGEVALRMALGATRRRISMQMFLEALVLASVAGAVGIAIMAWPLHLLREVFDTSVARGDALPYWFVVSVGPNTIVVVVGLVLLCAVLTGVLPALKLTDRHMRSKLQRVQEGVSGLRFGRATTIVVVSQVAISVALLTVAGAQLRTFVDDWLSLDDGSIVDGDIVPARYLTAQLRWDPAPLTSRAGEAARTESARQTQIRRALERQVLQEPDVGGVTFDAFLGTRPFDGVSSDASGPGWAYVISIAPNYFAVHDDSVLAGRAFDETDGANVARRVAIVNEAFVRTVLRASDAVGQRVRPIDTQSGRSLGEALEIIGIVPDSLNFEISQRGPGWVAQPAIYVPLTATAATLRMTVRMRNEPEQFVPRLRAIGARIDPTLVVHQPMPLERIDSIDRLFLRLYGFSVAFLVFAVVLLSTAGVYSMMSFLVAQRTREIGIRIALGATPTRVVRDVFSRALRQVGAGTALGLGVGFAASDGPFALSDGVFHHGPGLMMAVAALILATGVIACGIPLKRALRIQPTEALRAEG